MYIYICNNIYIYVIIYICVIMYNIYICNNYNIICNIYWACLAKETSTSFSWAATPGYCFKIDSRVWSIHFWGHPLVDPCKAKNIYENATPDRKEEENYSYLVGSHLWPQRQWLVHVRARCECLANGGWFPYRCHEKWWCGRWFNIPPLNHQ